ncbi:helix-turn-helix domain-containing protein [Bacillus subtilis]|uniref:helix-turn-helix domain-containing protein n=1 Tax=Bacillus subtilis TaxID=1423 RepID=UPI001F332F12|nr:helix-turn-helix transcriptional regulator [Bacillus subtilis]MEC1806973.1 helix-turn-helix transcriptional regulator [Bacillus subtilis]
MRILDSNIIFGEKIKEIRKDKNMSFNEFADLTGFTSSYIYKLENGKGNPTLKSINQFCEKLNVPVRYFF